MAALAFLAIATPAIRGDDPDRVTKLQAEKTRLEKRLEEIAIELDQIWAGSGVQCLGMTLVESTKELRTQHGLFEKFPGPIVSQIQDGSFFLANTAPGVGCSFWLVEHPEHSFFPKQECSPAPTYYPKTIRQFIRAVVDSAISPEEYQAMYDRYNAKPLERAEKFQDQPEVRERLLKAAAAKMPAEDVGKSICRVVFHFPQRGGTMTTHLRLNKEDLDQLRSFLKK